MIAANVTVIIAMNKSVTGFIVVVSECECVSTVTRRCAWASALLSAIRLDCVRQNNADAEQSKKDRCEINH